jgi:hypothetical protein
MDAARETVARGGRVAAETAEAATMVLAGGGAIDATAATQITRRPLPAQYEPPKRGRPLWPWLVGASVLRAPLLGGFFLHDSIPRQLEGPETVAVPYVVGIPQALAVKNVEDAGLIRRCIACPTQTSKKAPSSHRTRPRGRRSASRRWFASTSRPASPR